jgi:hypothetical protein
MRCSLVADLLVLSASVLAWADGPRDNHPDKVRPIPPPGIAVPEATRKQLQQGLDTLDRDLQWLRGNPKKVDSEEWSAGFPNVEVYHKAVRSALEYNEIYTPEQLEAAGRLLDLGRARGQELSKGKRFVMLQSGIHGYRSRIDGSVQPYFLVVPESYRANPATPHQYRLDIWCHGRMENLSELAFMEGQGRHHFQPPHAFVLHLYGRFCNANRFSGEIDCFEALADVRKHYPIDEDRIVMRGFSMGGAACWQFAVHHAGLWAAAAPGAGFAEAAEFLRGFQKEELQLAHPGRAGGALEAGQCGGRPGRRHRVCPDHPQRLGPDPRDGAGRIQPGERREAGHHH